MTIFRSDCPHRWRAYYVGKQLTGWHCDRCSVYEHEPVTNGQQINSKADALRLFAVLLFFGVLLDIVFVLVEILKWRSQRG